VASCRKQSKKAMRFSRPHPKNPDVYPLRHRFLRRCGVRRRCGRRVGETAQPTSAPDPLLPAIGSWRVKWSSCSAMMPRSGHNWKRKAARLRGEGIDVTTELRSGVPHHEILAAVAHDRPDLIVLGAVGEGRSEDLLIGSVAARVAESAPVPTLVVRQAKVLVDWLGGTEGLRLLCGVDRTASSAAAISALVPLVALGRVEVEAASVRTGREEDFSGDPDVRQRDVWERIEEALGEGPVQVHVRDRSDTAVTGFSEIGEEREAGLLVLGTHQRHGWERLTSPSFSRATLTQAATNVLCVPAAAVKADNRIPRFIGSSCRPTSPKLGPTHSGTPIRCCRAADRSTLSMSAVRRREDQPVGGLGRVF